MSVVKKVSVRWGVILLCMALGTWLGVFLQRFAATELLFSDFASFSFDLKEIDIIMVKVGFMFGLRLNLGTLLGAIAGIFTAR